MRSFVRIAALVVPFAARVRRGVGPAALLRRGPGPAREVVPLIDVEGVHPLPSDAAGSS